MNPTVTVIMPAYNSSELLAEAIDSVMQQTYADFEVLLIDHGTSGTTREICSDYMGAGTKFDERFEYHRAATGLSLSEARNTGVSTAQGRYIIYLNHDDSLKRDALEVLVDGQETGYVGVYANADLMDEDGHVYRTRKSKRFGDSKEAINVLLSSPLTPIWTPTLMVRKDVLQDIPSDESFGTVEDIEVLISILEHHQLKYVDREVYNFRTHVSNYSARSRSQTIKGWNKVYDKHVEENAKRRYLKMKRLVVILSKLMFEWFSDKK